MKDTSFKNIVLWIVFGALVGWIASAIVGVGSNLLLDIVAGILGAYVGGWIMQRTWKAPSGMTSEVDSINWRSFLVALLGAIVVLAIVKILT